jgi:hypothetical protein
MSCNFQAVCPYYRKKIQVQESIYKANVEKYCSKDFTTCAIHQVILKATFLAVPPDLYPEQTSRVAAITQKK